MSENQLIFHNYEDIVKNYIDSFYCTNKIFSLVVDETVNPNYSKLKDFFKLLDIDSEDDNFYMITKAILCARKGEVLYFRYNHFKNVAHYVLDNIPRYWTHFRLILKNYKHISLSNEILEDPKIQKKIEDKQSFIKDPNHLHNTYIEFLCPELDGRLIAWGEGKLNKDDDRSCYPVNIFKNLLKDKPTLPNSIKESKKVLELIKDYFFFTTNIIEEMPKDVYRVIFSFIQQEKQNNHSHSLSDYYGDFVTDIDFKNYLNPIVDFFDLKHFIDEMSFTDNLCYIELKNDKKVSFNVKTDQGWINFRKKCLLEKAIEFCEEQVQRECSYFFVEKNFN